MLSILSLVIAQVSVEDSFELMEVPDGFSKRIVATEPLVRDPVSFTISDRGELLVCESARQEQGVEDNRSSSWWLMDDLKLQTLEDRLAMYEKWAGKREGGMAYYSRWDDRLSRLVDGDGDGVFESRTEFGPGFNEPLDGTMAGVLDLGGDVWVTNIPHLWRLRDADGDGVAEEREIMHTGFGIRTALRGHDMHGLVLGPDGRLYWSIGDRGYNLIDGEGNEHVSPHTGAAFRCELDGSGLEVFHHGLRNPQELAFDDYGNLFTGDNNSDGGDQARLVYLVEGGETGWDMCYQTLEGENRRGPWNQEGIWKPRHKGQPAWTLPPMMNYTSGPSGMVMYPGHGLPDRYEDHMFLCDFRGSNTSSRIVSFAVQPDGAGYKVVDEHVFIDSVLATDFEFGYDGRMFVLDWGWGWGSKDAGRIYEVSYDEAMDPAADARSLFASGFEGADLPALLRHPDRRVRIRASVLLAKERRATVEFLRLARDTSAPVKHRLHGVWGLGMVGRGEDSRPSLKQLVSLVGDETPEIRAQALRILGDERAEAAVGQMLGALRDASPRVRFYAALGLGRIGKPTAVSSIERMLAENRGEDLYLQHAGVMGLLGCADEDRIAQCMKHRDPSVRLAATLVMRRRADPRLAKMLDDPSPKIVRAAASAISDVPVPEAMPALAESFDRILRASRVGGVHSGPTIRRMINANFRLGEAEGLERLLQAVSAPGVSEAMRREAFAAVSDWVQPSVRDRVIGHVRPIEPPVRDLLVYQAALQKHLPGLLESSPGMSGEIRTLANGYGVRFSDEVNLATLKDTGAPTGWRVLAFGQLVESEDTTVRDNAIALALDDRNRLLRAAAQPAVLARDAAEGQKLMTKSFRKGSIDVRQRTTAQLAELDSEWSEALLLEGLQAYGNGLPRALEIDVLEAARSRDTDALYEAVEAIEANWNAEDPLDGWRGCMDGGDADRGRTLFISHWAAQCQRCHAIGGDGGEAGPNLQDVGGRMSSEKLLESIIHPQGEVAEGYGPVSSMPEMKPLLTPLEVRDLVAYLSTLR